MQKIVKILLAEKNQVLVLPNICDQSFLRENIFGGIYSKFLEYEENPKNQKKRRSVLFSAGKLSLFNVITVFSSEKISALEPLITFIGV